MNKAAILSGNDISLRPATATTTVRTEYSVGTVYRLTATFPRDELYGLTTKLRRSSSSIAANLAEGCGRTGDAELARFCAITMGSASELEYHLLLARDLDLLKGADYTTLANQTNGSETDAHRIAAKADR